MAIGFSRIDKKKKNKTLGNFISPKWYHLSSVYPIYPKNTKKIYIRWSPELLSKTLNFIAFFIHIDDQKYYFNQAYVYFWTRHVQYDQNRVHTQNIHICNFTSLHIHMSVYFTLTCRHTVNVTLFNFTQIPWNSRNFA